jgi:hypothetical protein
VKLWRPVPPRGTFSEDHRPNSGSPLVLNGRGMHSAERLCGSGDDLIVWHVADVLSDVPAMPERVLELAVPVAPEHVRQRLTNLCAANASAPSGRSLRVACAHGYDDNDRRYR